MWDAISVIGSAAASAVGTAAGDEAYKYAKELLNTMNRKADDEADNDLEKNYEMLIKQAKMLYARRDDILAQAKTKQVTQVCEALISRVTKSEEEVQDLEIKYKKEKSKKRTWTQRLIGSRNSRIDLSKSMAEKCEKLHNLWLETKPEIGTVIELIQGQLRDKDVKRIGLWGMPGIGKTTILQILNNNEGTAKFFDIVIWVTVSRDCNLEKLQHEVAARLKLNIEGITDPNEIGQQIYRELKRKRCLLLLDEVWEFLDLRRIGDKGKDKVGASVWEDVATALGRAHNVVTPDDLKELSRVSSHEIVNRHIHKLVQALGETTHITTEYLTSEEKVVMANSKVEALEAESSKLRKNLINAMEEGDTIKEKVKVLTKELRVEKLLTVQRDEQLQSANQLIKYEAAKAVQAFQLTKEYNSVLFNWYFKGFELLKRYLTKHNPGVDLKGLDFEAIDKEMEADEAAEATATAIAEGNVPEVEDDALGPMVGDDALAA